MLYALDSEEKSDVGTVIDTLGLVIVSCYFPSYCKPPPIIWTTVEIANPRPPWHLELLETLHSLSSTW